MSGDGGRKLSWNAVGTIATVLSLFVAILALFNSPSPVVLFQPAPETNLDQLSLPRAVASKAIEVRKFEEANEPQEIDEEVPLERKLSLIAGMSNSHARDDKLLEVFRDAIIEKNEKVAFTAAGKIKSRFDSGDAYLSLVRWCIQMEKIDCAQNAAALIPVSLTSDDAWRLIALTCRARRNEQCVSTSASRISSSFSRDRLLEELGR